MDRLFWKTTLRRLPCFELLRGWRDGRQLRAWERAGRPGTPSAAHKRLVLRALARRFGLRTMVETGTYLGDALGTLRADFDHLISIELDERLHRAAGRRFRGDPGVRLLQGDSAQRLPEVLAGLDRPALFWLDGHCSGGFTARGEEHTPIFAELAAIAAHPLSRAHVLVIDDARLFGSEAGYPTLEALRERVRAGWPEATWEVADDLIRILPRERSDAAAR